MLISPNTHLVFFFFYFITTFCNKNIFFWQEESSILFFLIKKILCNHKKHVTAQEKMWEFKNIKPVFLISMSLDSCLCILKMKGFNWKISWGLQIDCSFNLHIFINIWYNMFGSYGLAKAEFGRTLIFFWLVRNIQWNYKMRGN